jgi:hypothetical protein
MSLVRKAASVEVEQPRIVSTPEPVRQVSYRQWTELVNEYLPQMWDAVSSVTAPPELRHEACTLAWLRLAQRDEVGPDDLTRSWLVMTARVETERAMARCELLAQRVAALPSQRSKREQS